MRILVTGSNGFIGSHLVPKLKELGHDVVGMDIKNNLRGQSQNVSSWDDCLRYVEGMDVVIHLAALIDVQDSIDEIDKYFENNLSGTFNILDASRHFGVKRFIFASSAAADSPQSPYGVTKLCGEIWCDIFNKCYGLSTISLRFFNVYGKGTDKGVIPTWIKKIKKGEMPELYGDGEQTRDFIYVKDVVGAITNAINSKACGVYDIGSGKSVTLMELCEKLLDITKSDLEIMPRKGLDGEVRHSEAGIVPAFKQLKWKPKYTLEEGLREMLKNE
jgi:nucleoside-diphosphate-sugar epimerase